MSWHNRVIWTEGMFLRPHHFQQQDRCFDGLIRAAVSAASRYSWGVRSLTLDHGLLETGKLSIVEAEGAMPDGSLFRVPGEQDPPPILDLGNDVRDRVVYLATPVERSALAANELAAAADGLARFQAREIEVYDTSEDSLGSRAGIVVGRMKLALLLQGEPRTGYQSMPLLRVIEVGTDRKVKLDDAFIPSCLDHRASAPLTAFLKELQGLLRQRGDTLAERVSTSGRGSVAEVADVLLLQLVNRLEPVVAHINEAGGLHPEELFRFFLAAAGELATFTTEAKRPEAFPAYDHDDLVACFRPVEEAIRRSLQWMREPTAIAIPIQEFKSGFRRAVVNDPALLASATFILEVSADLDADLLMKAFRTQSKLGPQDRIRDLVMQALPGIPMRPRPNAPRQLPYHANAIYFEVDTGHELWPAIEQTGILAFHVAGTFPNLAMTLWALKR